MRPFRSIPPNPSTETLVALTGRAYREGMAVTKQEHALLFLRATTSAAFADLQVVLLRELAARLEADGATADCAVQVEATADQLEAATRQTWCALRSVLPPPC
jgi:hypothetical protein